MTSKQHAVLWLGLSLIIIRLFTTNQWHDIWGTISGNSTGGSSGNLKIPGGGVAKNIGKAFGIVPLSPNGTVAPGKNLEPNGQPNIPGPNTPVGGGSGGSFV